LRVLLSAKSEGASTLHQFDRGGSARSSFYVWPEGTTGLFLNGGQEPLHLVA
jgi:hypothetical protein